MSLIIYSSEEPPKEETGIKCINAGIIDMQEEVCRRAEMLATLLAYRRAIDEVFLVNSKVIAMLIH